MAEKVSKQELLEKINICAQRFYIVHTTYSEFYSSFVNRILALEKNKNTRLYSKRHEFRSLYCTLEEQELKFFADRRIKSKTKQLAV